MAHIRHSRYALAALSAVATFGIAGGVANAVTTSDPLVTGSSSSVPISGWVTTHVVTLPSSPTNPNLPNCRRDPKLCVAPPRHPCALPPRAVLVPLNCIPTPVRPGGGQPGGHLPHHPRIPQPTPSDPQAGQHPAATPIQPEPMEPTFTG
jgi:hypothetical protein